MPRITVEERPFKGRVEHPTMNRASAPVHDAPGKHGQERTPQSADVATTQPQSGERRQPTAQAVGKQVKRSNKPRRSERTAAKENTAEEIPKASHHRG
ncbi:MAG: hypothetical protein ABSG34_10620, partial [Candidatus Sulfotelmatobacter sp.]